MRCANPKLLAGIVVAGLAIALLVPGVGRSIGPLLILGACPLSMIAMMVMMGRGSAATSRPEPSNPQSSTSRDAELADLRERLARLERTDEPSHGRA